MKRFFAPVCLALLTALVQPAAPVQAQSGILLKTFPLRVGKLLADPDRPQLYATLPDDNSLGVINTVTNTVITTLPIGTNPVALAISPDGTRLYVATNGSTSDGIGVIDLTSLSVLPSLPSPFPVNSIAAGLGNRLYLVGVGTSEQVTTGIAQIDATTGVLEGTLPGNAANFSGFLQISPDFQTLYYGSDNGSPAYLASFDVSTATPTFQQSNSSSVGSNGQGLTLSHNGQYLILPAGLGNGIGVYNTSLIPTSNLDGVIGSFATGAYPGLAVFSADDSTVYQVENSSSSNGVLKVFSTQTFNLLSSFDLPTGGTGPDGDARVTSLVVTSSGGYLYVAGTSGVFDGGPGYLMLVSTQTGPFFNGSEPLADGFYYLQFPDGNLFGYYNFNSNPYLFHADLGFEYPIDAADGSGGVYLYDFTSNSFFYTSVVLFPYLYDFSLNTFLYYYPDPNSPGHYTASPRYFYDFSESRVITL